MEVINGLNIFKDKRVLVTGDTGFKGSWLCLWLHLLGAKVLGYALPPLNKEDHFNLLNLKEIIQHNEGNICNFAELEAVFQEFQPEFLFHLAAQPLVRFSYVEPKLTFDSNVAGSVNVLEMVRTSKSLRSVIYVTSDKCYKNKEWLWGYRENDELGGKDPYSASKAAAEIVFASYFDSFFAKQNNLGIASVRAGNVIGGGDWAQDRIVPDSIRALSNNQSIVLRNPASTRPWQHVLDPLSGYLYLAARLYQEPKVYSGSWNFGPSVHSIQTVRVLAETFVKHWGAGSITEQNIANAPHEAQLLHLNCDKAHQQLGWQPRWDFETSIKVSVDWYKQVLQGCPALDISTQQIKKYMEN